MLPAIPTTRSGPSDRRSYVRRAEFGEAGLVTYLTNDRSSKVIILDVTWVG
jgi:hypothetical protein